MKTFRILAACFLFVFSVGGLAPAASRADDPASFDYFYNALQPYGQWVEVSGYGYCWQPAGVDENWQPYSDGYWVYTDAGWTWVSYEEYGFITYHYGRWARVEDLGWVWVPDYEWAPAWVSWREGGDYIGWAPLPPECRFDAEAGFGVSVDSTYDIGPGCYNFCQVSDFGAPVLRSVIIDRLRNGTIIIITTNITNITVSNRLVFCGGPDFEIISRRVGRPIQILRLERNTGPFDFHGGRGGFARAEGNRLIVMAPQIAPPSKQLAPPKVARVIPNARVDHGWAHVADPNLKQQIQLKIKAQSAAVDPRQAHARPVTPQQLQMIPTGNAPVGQPPAPSGVNSTVRRRDTSPVPSGVVPVNPGQTTYPPVHRRDQLPVTPGATPVNPGQITYPPVHRRDPLPTTPVTIPGRQNGAATGIQQPGSDAAAQQQEAAAAARQQQAAEAAARAQQQAAAEAAAAKRQQQAAEAAARQQQFMEQKAARQQQFQQQQQQPQQQAPPRQQQPHVPDAARGGKADPSSSPVR